MPTSSPIAEGPPRGGQSIAPPILRARARRAPGTVLGDHTSRVRLLRRAFPAAVGLILLTVLGWVAARAILTAAGEGNAPITTVHMRNPHFYGRDSSGRPFSITAKSATRDAGDALSVLMDQPVFMLQTGAPKPTVMRSLVGTYREDTRSLILSGHVTLEDAGGNRFDTERALIDTVTGVATGETGVAGTGPLGQITSSAYAVYDGGAHVFFKGNVRLHINQSSGRR